MLTNDSLSAYIGSSALQNGCHTFVILNVQGRIEAIYIHIYLNINTHDNYNNNNKDFYKSFLCMNSAGRRKIKYKLLVLLVSLHLETLETHICECIINAHEYSEIICTSDEINLQCVCTSRGYHSCRLFCSLM